MIHFRTRVKLLNIFVRTRLKYSCQNWNLTVGQFEKFNAMYCNLLRRMIGGGFKCFGDNYGDFRCKLDIKKVHAVTCITSDVSNFIRKQDKNYACHIVRMLIERCENELMFNDDKYQIIGRITPSLQEQVLKFNNSTIDNIINNSLKLWHENSTSSPI